MSILGGVVIGLVTAAALYAIRHNAEKGQVEWVADQLALESGKPTINIGAKWSKWGDVRCDIKPKCGADYCDAQCLSHYDDKSFSVALLSHVLEHLEDPEQALHEASRIADNVLVVLPSPVDVPAWVHPKHKWVFLGANKVSNNPALAASLLTTLGLCAIIGISSKGKGG